MHDKTFLCSYNSAARADLGVGQGGPGWAWPTLAYPKLFFFCKAVYENIICAVTSAAVHCLRMHTLTRGTVQL